MTEAERAQAGAMVAQAEAMRAQAAALLHLAEAQIQAGTALLAVTSPTPEGATAGAKIFSRRHYGTLDPSALEGAKAAEP